MNLREVTMKYGRLVVFIRNDSAEIWEFRYGRTLIVDTVKIMSKRSYTRTYPSQYRF
jgi:hypothetical protein